MATKKKIGLFIWPDDKPIGGNVFNLSVISNPRKEFDEYVEGERVEVRYPGFGTVRGIIGKISDETGKKDLENILNTTDCFHELVKKYLPLVQTLRRSPRKSPAKSNKKQKSATPSKSKRKSNANDESEGGSTYTSPPKKKSVTPSSKSKSNSNVDDEGGSPSKKKKEELQRIAKELSFTELKLTPVKPVPQRFEKPPSEVVGESLRLINSPSSSSLQKDDNQCTRQQYENTQRVTCIPPQTNDSYQYLQNRVLYLEQVVQNYQQNFVDLNTRLCSCETSLQWAWRLLNQNVPPPEPTGLQSSVTQFKTETQASSDLPSARCTTDEGSSSMNPQSTASTKGSHEMSPPVPLYNGFTKEQLQQKLQKESCYKKGTTMLFRSMFTTEEYEGRSMTGQGNRPALENQEKLEVLKSMIKDKWPSLQMVLVRQVITHLLKPSRVNKTLKSTKEKDISTSE